MACCFVISGCHLHPPCRIYTLLFDLFACRSAAFLPCGAKLRDLCCSQLRCNCVARNVAIVLRENPLVVHEMLKKITEMILKLFSSRHKPPGGWGYKSKRAVAPAKDAGGGRDCWLGSTKPVPPFRCRTMKHSPCLPKAQGRVRFGSREAPGFVNCHLVLAATMACLLSD